MRQAALTAVLLVLASTAPAWAIGPGFDCAKIRTPLARFICGSPALSRDDLAFVQAYYALRQQVGPAGWPALKQEDLGFQKQTSSRCGISPSGALPPDAAGLTACLARRYAKQRSTWLSRLTGAALAEASRPVEQHVGLQRDLQALGFLPPTATVDGVYGAATRTAILAWQRSRGLPETGFLGDADAQALAGQAGNDTPGSPPGAADISSFSCKDIVGASQEALIPVVGEEIQYMRRRYPDLTTGWGSFTQTPTPEAIQRGKDIGAFVKAKCDQLGEQDASLAAVLDAAAGLMRAGQLEAWLEQHRPAPTAASAPPPAHARTDQETITGDRDAWYNLTNYGGCVRSEEPSSPAVLSSTEN